MEKKLLFEAKDINKTYPGVQALKSVNLNIYEGEILGLVGENGAGKTTLFRIINGVERADKGEMLIRGKKYAPRNPREANALGVGMVFQEQSIVSNLTVGQNIFFGKEKEFKTFGFINWRKMYTAAADILKEIDNEDIPPEKKAGELTFAKRQMVEIAKVLNTARSSKSDRAIILLDEPTSVLGDAEIKQLYTEMKKLKEEGNAVIFVSHRLDEVLEITDRIYVFKDGQNVGEIKTSEANEDKIYELMVGRSGTGEYYKIDKQTDPKDNVVLSLKNLSKKGAFRDVSFDLHEGEVISIAGVVGSGKEEVCEVIAGDDKATSGVIELFGKKISNAEPSAALRKGILSIPKERREEGILGILPVYENICLSNYKNVSSGLFISKGKQLKKSKEWIGKLNIKCSSEQELVESLSAAMRRRSFFSRVLASEAMCYSTTPQEALMSARRKKYIRSSEKLQNRPAAILLGDTLAECIGLKPGTDHERRPYYRRV